MPDLRQRYQIRHYSKKPAALDSRFALCFQHVVWTKFDRTAILSIKPWQRTMLVRAWVNAILTGSLRVCSPQDK
jgi:hypothetical protein